MGQCCFKPSIYGDLPTRILITIEGASGSELLNLIPDSYESLVQSVYPFAAKHLVLTANDYLVVQHLKSPTTPVHIAKPKQFKRALRSCKGREMLLKVTKGNFQSALSLHLEPANDKEKDVFFSKFSSTLGEFRTNFVEFSQAMHQLLQLTSAVSVFTMHPNIESAASAVLMTLISEGPGEKIRLSTSIPFISLSCDNLHPVAFNTLRLWNDFMQEIGRLEPLITALRVRFPLLLTLISNQAGVKGKPEGCSMEAGLRTKQSFEDACVTFESTLEQLVRFFTRLEYDQSHHKPRLGALERMCRVSKTQGLTSVLALFDLKGNARAVEALSKEEADLSID